MDANAYLDTVTTVNGKSSAKNVTIKGNATANTIYGGAGNNVLEGGAGDDYLNGGKGNDTLSGGAGKDLFVHYETFNDDTITDYKAGEDIIKIGSGSISKTEVVNGADVKFTIGTGSVTVQNGAGKSISLEDSRGSYTASGTTIKLGSDFSGTMDANAYLDTVTSLDGRSAVNNVTLNGNDNDNTIYGGAGNDVLNGGAGNDYMNGGAGSDTYFINSVASDTSIQIDQSTFNDGDADVLQLSSVDSSDVQFSLEDGALTIAHDNGGTITVSGWNENPLSKVIFADNTELTGAEITALTTSVQSVVANYETVNGGNGKDYLLVNGNNNKLYGHAGDDTLEVLAGRDNMLTGGTGNDTYIVHWPLRSEKTGCYNVTIDNRSAANGDVENLVIKGASSSDFNIYISGGNNDDLVIQDNIPYNNSDYIVIHDWANHGFETVSFDDKTLTNEEIYSILADQDHEIHMNQSMSYEAGQWKDVLIYEGTGLKVTITGYVAGEDKLKFTNQSISKVEVNGNDALLTLTDGGTITVKNMAGKTIDYVDFDGNSGVITPTVTQNDVMKNFMRALVEYPTTVASDALNTAVNTASNGLFASWDALIEQFVSDVRNYGGTSDDGKGYVLGDNQIMVPESSTDTFLKNYCGIDLTNEDTGSITGADAGGDVVKTLDSIMPETGDLSAAEYPELDKVIGKLTVKWPEMDSLSDKGKMIVAGLNTYWIDAALDLIEESYGISYPDNIGFTMNVTLQDKGKNGKLASASSTNLFINMGYWENIDSTDANGISSDTNYYFDSTIAHEFTHAVMSAALYRNNPHQEGNSWVIDGPKLWNGLATDYTCVTEGLAELTRGVDFDRLDEICELAQVSNADRLQSGLVTSGAYDGYAGGYMLLRYFAKQTADNFAGTSESLSSPLMASFAVDSVTSAVSSLWSETTAAVADTGSELASSMVSISNAMLTPLDSTDSNVFGSGSLASDLFSDKKNNGFIS